MEFERSTGLQKALISDRLKYLISEKLMHVQTIAGGKHKEYVFDDQSLALFPAALLMLGWEQKWNGDTGPDIHVIHTDCGHELIPEIHYKACHKVVLINDLTITKDSAFLDEQQSFVKRRRQAGLNRSGTLVFTALIGVRRHDGFL